jgi:Arc/MetJ-type ribon-helix-helix transcriptional regulator
MLSQDFPADVQQFLLQEVASGKFLNEADVVVEAVRRYRDSDASATEVIAEHEYDTLNWDDLIPVPPARPSGRVRVRVKMVGRDQPLPAEDPWAK